MSTSRTCAKEEKGKREHDPRFPKRKDNRKTEKRPGRQGGEQGKRMIESKTSVSATRLACLCCALLCFPCLGFGRLLLAWFAVPATCPDQKELVTPWDYLLWGAIVDFLALPVFLFFFFQGRLTLQALVPELYLGERFIWLVVGAIDLYYALESSCFGDEPDVQTLGIFFLWITEISVWALFIGHFCAKYICDSSPIFPAANEETAEIQDNTRIDPPERDTSQTREILETGETSASYETRRDSSSVSIVSDLTTQELGEEVVNTLE